MAGKIKLWSTTPGDNNSAPPNGWPEGMAPSAVNNTARQDRASVAEWYQDAEWIDYGHTIVTAAGQVYTISGDVTAIYRVGRAIRQNLSSAAIGIITNSVFSTPNTLVTVSGYVPSAAPTSVEVGAADRATSRLSAGTSAVDFATYNGNIQYKVNNVTVGLMTSTGLNAVNLGATTPGTVAATTLSTTGLATLASLTTAAATITGGAISGITDLAVADGGTGASTAAAARTNLGLVIGTDVEPHDNGLTALAAFNTNGILVQTANDTFAGRTITTPNAGLTTTNGDGVAGNIAINPSDDLAALEALASTGLAARTASNTWAQRTITGTAAEITVANGNGVSGNPTLSLPAALTFTGKTVTGGTFTGITDIAVADGGTGASTAAAARTNLGVEIGTDVQAFDADLSAIAALASTGIAVRSAANTWVQRTITTPNAGLTTTNGNGVSGNVIINPSDDLAAIEALGSTGIAVRSAANTWVQRTITGTTNEIDVTNGNGVSGNPTLTLADGVRRLIATGSINNTSLSITVAANSYTRLFLVVAGWYHSTTDWLPYIRVNNNAVSSSYYSIVIDANVNADSGFHGSSNNDVVRLKAGGGLIEAGQANAFGAEISFFNPNRVSENKAFNIQSSMNLESNGIYTANDIQRCRVLATAVVSSIQLYTRSSNAANLPATTLTPTGGVYYLYGE